MGRDGKLTYKRGCGSTNIRRKVNVPRDESSQIEGFNDFDDIIAGATAYISGIQLKPLIDWEMGENDDEAEVRHEARQLAINGRHKAFRTADKLTGGQVSEDSDLESIHDVGALTFHIIDAASLAWGRWHSNRVGNKMDEFLTRYTELKNSCIEAINISQKNRRS